MAFHIWHPFSLNQIKTALFERIDWSRPLVTVARSDIHLSILFYLSVAGWVAWTAG